MSKAPRSNVRTSKEFSPVPEGVRERDETITINGIEVPATSVDRIALLAQAHENLSRTNEETQSAQYDDEVAVLGAAHDYATRLAGLEGALPDKGDGTIELDIDPEQFEAHLDAAARRRYVRNLIGNTVMSSFDDASGRGFEVYEQLKDFVVETEPVDAE